MRFFLGCLLFSLLTGAGLIAGCATAPIRTVDVQVVTLEDLSIGGYQRIGVLQVSRERLGIDLLSSDDYAWALQALQKEAQKIGADAITQPELSSHAQSLLLIPLTEIRGRANAIRFQ